MRCDWQVGQIFVLANDRTVDMTPYGRFYGRNHNTMT